MDDSTKIILSKLEEIDSRLKKIESEDKTPVSVKKNLKDPLFDRAWQIAEKYDEVPSSLLQKFLVIDKVRAEQILDQLEQAGLGQCVWEER